jgi:hypothetical protein
MIGRLLVARQESRMARTGWRKSHHVGHARGHSTPYQHHDITKGYASRSVKGRSVKERITELSLEGLTSYNAGRSGAHLKAWEAESSRVRVASTHRRGERPQPEGQKSFAFGKKAAPIAAWSPGGLFAEGQLRASSPGPPAPLRRYAHRPSGNPPPRPGKGVRGIYVISCSRGPVSLSSLNPHRRSQPILQSLHGPLSPEGPPAVKQSTPSRRARTAKKALPTREPAFFPQRRVFKSHTPSLFMSNGDHKGEAMWWAHLPIDGDVPRLPVPSSKTPDPKLS